MKMIYIQFSFGCMMLAACTQGDRPTASADPPPIPRAPKREASGVPKIVSYNAKTHVWLVTLDNGLQFKVNSGQGSEILCNPDRRMILIKDTTDKILLLEEWRPPPQYAHFTAAKKERRHSSHR